LEIRQSYKQSRKLYGVLRITRDLSHKGILCGKNRVYCLMKANGISSCRQKANTRRPLILNIPACRQTGLPGGREPSEPGFFYEQAKRGLDREYHIPACRQTGIPTDEGWLYLAAVVDLGLRKVVGWSMDTTMKQGLVINAL